MSQKVLLYARALPTKLAVNGALDMARLEPELCASPVELLDKVRAGGWDAIVLDGDGSPVPIQKLVSVVSELATAGGAVVVAFAREPLQQPLPADVFIYDRVLGRLPLLGAINRLLMARSRKPILKVPRGLEAKMRRSLRVPMLVPVAFRSPARHTAWREVEVLDVSVGGAGLADLPGFAPGEVLDVRNLLTKEEATFRVAWKLDEFDEVAGGMAAQQQALRFWLPGQTT